MSTSLIAILLLAATIAGCSIAVPDRQSQQRRHSQERIVVDTEKMAVVDRAARESGAEVHWVNPPVKRVR